jgi:hypothetical protein
MARMRKWLRFSLRTLLLLITALCVWLGIQVTSARRQREAVAAIIKAGGTVFYDYEMVPDTPFGYNVNKMLRPPGAAWLRQLVGEDYFRTAGVVWLPSSAESAVDQLAKLSSVQAIRIEGEVIPLHTLAHLSRLRSLSLMGNRIDSLELSLLPNPARLTHLVLVVRNVDDAAMERISRFSNLEALWLKRTQITDVGLAHARKLSKLEQLYLDETAITDAGLQHLAALKKLRLLSLTGTHVSTAGVNGLRTSLPNAKIYGP